MNARRILSLLALVVMVTVVTTPAWATEARPRRDGDREGARRGPREEGRGEGRRPERDRGPGDLRPLVLRFEHISCHSFAETLAQLAEHEALRPIRSVPHAINEEANAVVFFAPEPLADRLAMLAEELDQPNVYEAHCREMQRREQAEKMECRMREHRMRMEMQAPRPCPPGWPCPMPGRQGGRPKVGPGRGEGPERGRLPRPLSDLLEPDRPRSGARIRLRATVPGGKGGPDIEWHLEEHGKPERRGRWAPDDKEWDDCDDERGEGEEGGRRDPPRPLPRRPHDRPSRRPGSSEETDRGESYSTSGGLGAPVWLASDEAPAEGGDNLVVSDGETAVMTTSISIATDGETVTIVSDGREPVVVEPGSGGSISVTARSDGNGTTVWRTANGSGGWGGTLFGPLRLLRDDEVRRHIGLTEDQALVIDDLGAQFTQRLTALREEMAADQLAPEDREMMTEEEQRIYHEERARARMGLFQKMREESEALAKSVREILTEDQMAQLEKIAEERRQSSSSRFGGSRSMWALTSEDAIKTLGLTEAQVTDIRAVLDASRTEVRDMMRSAMDAARDLPAENRGEAMRQMWEDAGRRRQEMQQATEDQVMKLLTPDQQRLAREKYFIGGGPAGSGAQPGKGQTVTKTMKPRGEDSAEPPAPPADESAPPPMPPVPDGQGARTHRGKGRPLA